MLCHDPRVSDDRSQKVETDNPALVSAEFARIAFPGREILWDEVAVLADYCDHPVFAYVRGVAGADIEELQPARRGPDGKFYPVADPVNNQTK